VSRLRPLQSHIKKILLTVITLTFVVTGSFVGWRQYSVGQQEVARVLTAQIRIAQSLMPSLLLAHDRRLRAMAGDLAGRPDQEVLARVKRECLRRDPFDICYVLNPQGRIVYISREYDSYQGFNPSHMPHVKEARQVSAVFQSVFSKRSVVALKYRLNANLRLIYERDIGNILPALLHLEKGEIFDRQSLVLLTSEGVAAYHPDQNLVRTRHHLAYDMKNMQGPNSRGLYSYEYQDKRYYAVRVELQTPRGWLLYLQVPARPLMITAVKEIALQLVEMLVLLGLLTAAIQFILRRFFSQPVQDIVDALARYEPESSYPEVLQPRKSGVREFARISQAINDMARDVSLSTERFRRLVDSLDALVYVADMETYELLYINRYGIDLFGDITGKLCWQSLQSGQTGPCPFCTNHLLIDEEGRPQPTHVWPFQNTVTGEWYECRDQAIPWTDGRLVRMEIALNITESKQAQDALADEKERLAVTLRSIGDGVITTDTAGVVTMINMVAERLTGWRQTEAVGRDLHEIFHIIHAKSGEPVENPVDKVVATGQVVELVNHTVLIAKDGTPLSIADSGAPIRDKNSEIVGVVLVFRDETEKNRLQEQSIKAQKLESVGVLAGGIAHDFNNILTAIMGNISLALTDTSLAADTAKVLEDAEKASVRARNLTHQLLTFAKGGEPVKESTNIASVITDSADFVLHGSMVSCRYDIPDDLWLVEVDHGQISQVVQNLIINAKEAMPDGGEIMVSCSNVPVGSAAEPALKGDSRFVRIAIRDTGPGIPAEMLTRIFDPYFSTKEEGSGLGLAICHSIVHKHDGHIAVQSQPGQGTEFVIYLPEGKAVQKKVVEEEAATSRPARVMVMDDEEMILNLSRQMLNRLGHEVVLAHGGQEALALYQESLESGNPVDLVIMDLTIPGGMGGKEAIGELLALDPQAKVIVASGYSNDPVVANFRDYGFAAALVKPFQLEPFSRVVNKVLAAGQGEQQG